MESDGAPETESAREETAMSLRVTWFLIGAAAASAVWLIVLRVVDQELLRTFLGLAGH